MQGVAGVHSNLRTVYAVQGRFAPPFQRPVNQIVVNENPVFAGLHGRRSVQCLLCGHPQCFGHEQHQPRSQVLALSPGVVAHNLPVLVEQRLVGLLPHLMKHLTIYLPELV